MPQPRSLRRPPVKDIPDLKPENKKKRVEPPKPWGKFERYLIMAFFVGMAAIPSVLAVIARSGKLPNVPRLSVPRSMVEDRYTLYDRPQDTEDTSAVEAELKSLVADASGVYAVWVIDLTSGVSYGMNEREIITAASLIKLPVIAAFYREVEKGNLYLGTIYTLNDADKIGGSGSISGKPAGTEYSYQDLVDAMGKQSDNTAFGVIRRVVGDETIVKTMKQLGMVDTDLANNETTAFDTAEFFRNLWVGKAVEPEYKESILESLTDTIYESWIPEGVPDSIKVAHKFGREVHVVNDAGIVMDDHPYVVAILTQGVVEKEADELIPQISRIIYAYESR